MEHFGVTIREGKYGFNLKRENYAIIDTKSSLPKFKTLSYADEDGKYYTEEWCNSNRGKCLQNFDLNMQYYKSLNHDEFQIEIANFIDKYKQFHEVFDLKLYSEIGGYYIMIMDQYCQIYVGTSRDIKKRIQQHWTKNVKFDRLLFPMGAVDSSVLSVDCFRALDTTRILACENNDIYEKEDTYINSFSHKFVLNRIGGGLPEKGLIGFLQVQQSIKSKKLNSRVGEK